MSVLGDPGRAVLPGSRMSVAGSVFEAMPRMARTRADVLVFHSPKRKLHGKEPTYYIISILWGVFFFFKFDCAANPGSSSLTMDQTQDPCIGNMES